MQKEATRLANPSEVESAGIGALPATPRRLPSPEGPSRCPRCVKLPDVAPFPRWSHFPRNVRPHPWVGPLVGVVAAAEAAISTPAGGRLDSDGVLLRIAPGLAALGYTVEKGKKVTEKIDRPVLFGEGGATAVTMEVDAFHGGFGIAVEVEAGRAWNGNAVYCDLVRASLLLDARALVLMVPLAY